MSVPDGVCACGFSLKRRHDENFKVECIHCKQLWFDFEEPEVR